MLDNFDSFYDSASTTGSKFVEDLTELKTDAGNIISNIGDFSDSIFNQANELVDKYGDPFGIVDSYAGGILGVAQGRVNNYLNAGEQLLGLSNIPTPYQTVAKQYLNKMMKTPFRQGWQWIIEADDAPEEFEIYAKDVSLGLGSIDPLILKIGGGSIAIADTSSVGEITLTVRDHQDGRVEKWFSRKLGSVKNKDGTVNLPKDYIFELRLYLVSESGVKELWRSYKVWAAKNNIDLGYEKKDEFMAYSLTFQKFKSLGS